MFLNSGEVVISTNPQLVWTVLGSCVTIILYSSRLKASAICHAKLPEQFFDKTQCSDLCPETCVKNNLSQINFDYVTCAFRYMFDEFRKLSVADSEIEVSLIGGSTVLHGGFEKKSVGYKNVQTAVKIIKKSGLKISKKEVGGTKGRTINIFTDSGEIQIINHSM